MEKLPVKARRRAFLRRASGLIVPLAFPAILRGQGIPEPILSLMNAPAPRVAAGDTELFTISSIVTNNNFTGPLGITFTWGTVGATVTQLGRYINSGNGGTHTVKLMSPSCVQLAAVSILTGGATAGTYKYVTLGTPFVILPNTGFFLFSVEASGADTFIQSCNTVSAASAGLSFSANANSDGVSCFTGTQFTGSGFPNLKFHL